MLKRYQYWSKDGIKWTNWFNSSLSDTTVKVQFKGTDSRQELLNEFKEEEITIITPRMERINNKCTYNFNNGIQKVAPRVNFG